MTATIELQAPSRALSVIETVPSHHEIVALQRWESDGGAVTVTSASPVGVRW